MRGSGFAIRRCGRAIARCGSASSQTSPTEYRGYQLLGIDAREHGDTARALPLLARAFAMEPRDRRVRFEYGQVLYSTARYADAVAVLAPLLRDGDVRREPAFVAMYLEAVGRSRGAEGVVAAGTPLLRERVRRGGGAVRRRGRRAARAIRRRGFRVRRRASRAAARHGPAGAACRAGETRRATVGCAHERRGIGALVGGRQRGGHHRPAAAARPAGATRAAHRGRRVRRDRDARRARRAGDRRRGGDGARRRARAARSHGARRVSRASHARSATASRACGRRR